MFKLSKRSLKRLEDINPVLIDIIQAAITDSPYDFGIPQNGGFRTAEDQNLLYNKGVSKCDGYKRKSYHQSGNAFDIYLYIDKKASWDKDKLEAVARHIQLIAKEQFDTNIKWGGDFKSFYDGCHFEIKTEI